MDQVKWPHTSSSHLLQLQHFGSDFASPQPLLIQCICSRSGAHVVVFIKVYYFQMCCAKTNHMYTLVPKWLHSIATQVAIREFKCILFSTYVCAYVIPLHDSLSYVQCTSLFLDIRGFRRCEEHFFQSIPDTTLKIDPLQVTAARAVFFLFQVQYFFICSFFQEIHFRPHIIHLDF